MTQKTIKALYKQPVDYKLMRDGYKTITGVINAQDGMPKVLDLPVPSELYTTDLEYNVDIDVNGAPVITTSEFTLPDDQICEAKEYCYAPKGTNYNYIRTQEVEYKEIYNQNFVIYNNPTIDMTSGIATNFSNGCIKVPTVFYPSNNSNWEFQTKIKFTTTTSDGNYLLFNGEGNPTNCGIGMYVRNNNLALDISLDASSWTHQLVGANTLSTNIWYWIKLTFDGTTYTLSHSTDKINWIIDITQNGSMFKATVRLALGAIFGYNGYNGFSGPIDLFETYIKVDDRYWWSPWIQKKKTEEVITQIPGVLDSSVTTDDWQQNQEYKLYQLKNQNNTDTLQLTENSITDTTQKYKQYINQLTIPARDYKWYYNGIPQSKYANFWSHGATIKNEVGINFTGGPIEVFPLNYMGYDSNVVTAIFNIETGDITTDCVFFDMYSNHEEEASVLFAIRNSKFSYNTYTDPTQIIYGDTILSSNTKYWVALSLNKTQMTLELYLIQDNNYSKEQLPDISLWLKQFEYNITNPETIYAYSYIGASTSSSVLISRFNGKVYLNNMFATRDLTTSYEYLCWESYSYSNFVYRWYANKSLYDYIENENYADILNFSDSWVNVTNDWKTQKQYVNPEVCLMPIDGGETVTEYSPNGTLVGNISFDRYEGILSDASPSDYLTLSEPFMPEDKTWEVNIKVKTPSTTDEMHYIMGSLTEYYWTIGGELSANNTFGFGITSNGEAWDIAWLAGTTIVTPDTWYWIKLSFTGTEYKFELSTDGETYNLEASVENSTPIYQNSTNSYIHLGTQATGFTYWTGEIDLTQCQIKINNNAWWSGTSIVANEHQYKLPSGDYISGCLYNYNDEGEEHSFDVYYDSDYTQPILVSSGESYTDGTKVDTITIPAHRTWEYTTGGNWGKITYVDTSYSNYTYDAGNLVLTKYTGSDTDVIVPNAVI